MDPFDKEIGQFLWVAESKGWDTAFYDLCRAQVKRNSTVPENQRAADWKYLLPLNQDSIALVFGCGWGTVPISLAESCAKVYTIDSAWHKVIYLNIRKKQQGIRNLYPIYVNGDLNLPFSGRRFDLITLGEFGWRLKTSIQFQDAIQSVNDLLNAGGMLFLSLGNRLGFQRLLRRKEKGMLPSLHTIVGYKRILQAEGFTDIQFYAPLPHHEGVPLFYIPLDGVQALNFFFQHLFPLFEAVSPEVKRSYALEYGMAKLAVRIAQSFRLTGLAKFFVPGFNIIAKKAL